MTLKSRLLVVVVFVVVAREEMQFVYTELKLRNDVHLSI